MKAWIIAEFMIYLRLKTSRLYGATTAAHIHSPDHFCPDGDSRWIVRIDYSPVAESAVQQTPFWCARRSAMPLFLIERNYAEQLEVTKEAGDAIKL
ncbi:MAG: hypothetical protein ACXWIP_16665, partial [Burkholderiales bacterium]